MVKPEPKGRELVTVTRDQVKELLLTNFSEFGLTEFSSSTPHEYYDLKPVFDQGCYFHVKIPTDVNTAGKALHIFANYQFKNKENRPIKFAVYPSKNRGEAIGLGNQVSRSVYRDKNWKSNLMLEATTGLQMCKTMYESNLRFSTENKQEAEEQRKKIYDTFENRLQVKLDKIDKKDHCNELVRESKKNECFDELKALEERENILDQEANRLMKFWRVKPH